MRKLFLVIPLLAMILGGCQTKTLSAEEFLYAYRSGGMSDENSSPGASKYLGREGDYQMVLITGGAPAMVFVNEQGRKIRCRADALPADFPRGFVTLGTGESTFESSEDTREYVREYLARVGSPGSKPKPPTIGPDADDWNKAK